MSAYEKLLKAQGSISTFAGQPVENIPSYYKAENQLPTEASIGLYRAAEEGNLDAIRQHLNEGGNPNWFHNEEEGATSLFAACSKGHIEAVQLLIDNGAAVEIRLLTTKESLLHICCASNALAMVEFLVQGPAQELLDCTNAFGNTPLHVACMGASADIVQFLLDSGASSTLQNRRRSTALHFVSYSQGDDEALTRIVNLLVEKQADVNATDSDGQTPLHSAAIKESVTVCRLLLNSGATKDVKDGNGHTPLYYAQVKGNSALIDLLSLGGEEEAKK